MVYWILKHIFRPHTTDLHRWLRMKYSRHNTRCPITTRCLCLRSRPKTNLRIQKNISIICSSRLFYILNKLCRFFLLVTKFLNTYIIYKISFWSYFLKQMWIILITIIIIIIWNLLERVHILYFGIIYFGFQKRRFDTWIFRC